MKTTPFIPILACTLLLAACDKSIERAGHDPNAIDHPADCPECSHEALGVEVIELFNGKNLDGWSHLLWSEDGSAKSLSMEDVWSVKDGVLICKGQPLGYLRTTADYQDFVLNLEWRWPEDTKPTNSGVLVRIAAEPATFLPKSIESQLEHGNAGDLYGFFGASLTGDPQRYKLIQTQKIGELRSIKKIKPLELPVGEWNHYRIEVKGDTIRTFINGELANEGSGLDVLAGPIGLQSEGSEIQFRNIRLEPLAPQS